MSYSDSFPASIPSRVVDYTAAIVYLGSVQRSRELILSLTYLYKNVPSAQPWPIVIFYAEHEEESNRSFNEQSTRNGLASQLLSQIIGKADSVSSAKSLEFVSRIEFVPLAFTLPSSVPESITQVDPVYAEYWPGYHSMCRFYASFIFQHPRLRDLTYYMRLDTDSYIYEPLCYDPIDEIHWANQTYAYRSKANDPSYVVKGMWEFAKRYAGAHPEESKMLEANGWQWKEEGSDIPLYYNNFEVSLSMHLETSN